MLTHTRKRVSSKSSPTLMNAPRIGAQLELRDAGRNAYTGRPEKLVLASPSPEKVCLFEPIIRTSWVTLRARLDTKSLFCTMFANVTSGLVVKVS